ncbi:hypothetical protein SHIRM173S_05619 [Streptomyces hirsutus]
MPTTPPGFTAIPACGRQTARELHRGRDGERHVGPDDLTELFLGAEDRDVRLALDLHRGQVQRAAVRSAAVGQRYPQVAPAQYLDDPAVARGDAQGGGEHLLHFVAGPSAVRMGVSLCREARREVHLPTACLEPLLWLKG